MGVRPARGGIGGNAGRAAALKAWPWKEHMMRVDEHACITKALGDASVSVQGKYIQLVKGFRDISPEIPRLIPQMLCPQSIMSMYTPDPFHLRVGFVVGVGGECGVCGGGGGVLLIIRRSCFQISNGRR